MTDSPVEGDSYLMVESTLLSSPSTHRSVDSEPACDSSRVPAVRSEGDGWGSTQGARWTLERVYATQFRFVWRCLRNLGVPEATVDDAVQDVFLVVDRKLADFSGDLRPWLFAIVRRIALRYRKRALTEGARFVPACSSDGQQEPLAARSDLREELEKRECLDLAFRALDRLDELKREVFVFCMIEGFSAPEVALIVGAPPNTIYSRLRTAKSEFSTIVAALMSEAPGRPPSAAESIDPPGCSGSPPDPTVLRSMRSQS